MTKYLLAVSIGPVQQFIAAARRTRDLWFGSYMLSEISKAVAKNISETVGINSLIFPAPERDTDLASATDFNVANVILAVVDNDLSPKVLSDKAEEAAQHRWMEFAKDAKKKANELIDEAIWNEQKDDFIEFYSAWTPFEKENEYRRARERVMLLLSGRKSLRDFKPGYGRSGVWKSSLDGARETVLDKNEKKSTPKLRLSEGEQLDIVGLTKRLAEKKQYPSVARIAADPWVKYIHRSSETDRRLKKVFENLKKRCGETRGIIPFKDKFPLYQEYPYEGTTLFKERYDSLAHELGFEKCDSLFTSLFDALRDLLKHGLGEPDPYFAVLVADGDKMGKAIAKTKTIKEHRCLSRQLAEFAKAADDIVVQNNGVCVYAGGDDVLAFLPLNRCLDCSRALYKRFHEEMKKAVAGEIPTLSVGIAIGHFMVPLEDLLNYGRAAEKDSKQATVSDVTDVLHGDRNGFAIHVYPRSGSRFVVRERWLDDKSSLDRRLKLWSQWFTDRKLPGKLPYDLRELARTYTNWPNPETLGKAMHYDVCLMFKQKSLENISELLDRVKRLDTADDLFFLAEELLISRWLAGNTPFDEKEKDKR